MLEKTARWLVALALAATSPFAGNPAQAQQPPPGPPLTFKATDPNEKGDGTLSPLAREAITHGPLPMGKADIDAKAAANKASNEALKARPQVAPSERSWRDETIQPDLSVPEEINIPGQSDPIATPSDSTGAIGPARYIQLINRKAGLYNASNGLLLVSGTLDGLAGNFGSTKADPQIIFDATSSRYYYTMLEVFSASDNRLAFGFSKSILPIDLSDAWCHYEIAFGPTLPDFPKLGDSQDFVIIGVNAFFPTITNGAGQFAGADLIAISKPPPGLITCPPARSFNFSAAFNLLDSNGDQVFTPVPANQIYGVPDDSHPPAPPAGFVIARNGSLPSNDLWFFNVTKASNGQPIFGSARRLTVDSYNVPPAAAQASDRTLDTSDARMTQAVQAFRPFRGRHSLWTQHTIRSPSDPGFSVVRLYEVDPLPSTPVLLDSVFIFSALSSLFNAAISPDRQALGTTEDFGNNWVIEYNVSGPTMFPRIDAASRLTDGPIQFTILVGSDGPYTDTVSCPDPGDTCRWGDYSGASPDPNPAGLGVSGSGVVWGTNQLTSNAPPPPPPTPSFGNWRTQIFALQP